MIYQNPVIFDEKHMLVRNKLYREFYHGFRYIANEGSTGLFNNKHKKAKYHFRVIG